MSMEIAEYLYACGEPEMAEAVDNMHNRLEAFSDGLDRDAIEAAGIAVETLTKQRDEEKLYGASLIQQLAHMTDDADGLRMKLREAEKRRDGRLDAIEKLAVVEKQRDELLETFGLVIDELESRHGKAGNAPGHGHEIPVKRVTP